MKHYEADSSRDRTAAHPACPHCHAEMTISRIVPEQAGHETRTYHCAACGEDMAIAARTASLN